MMRGSKSIESFVKTLNGRLYVVSLTFSKDGGGLEFAEDCDSACIGIVLFSFGGTLSMLSFNDAFSMFSFNDAFSVFSTGNNAFSLPDDIIAFSLPDDTITFLSSETPMSLT